MIDAGEGARQAFWPGSAGAAGGCRRAENGPAYLPVPCGPEGTLARFPVVFRLTPAVLAATVLMAAGVWLHRTERHEHEHVPAPMYYEHLHVHDEHHRHQHAPTDAPGEPHSHPHRHAPLQHSHAHYPGLHHRRAH